MDIESIGINIEIVHKIIGQWQRTGRLSDIERAFLLDKLKEVQDAVEINGKCETQSAKCEIQETSALETFEIFEIAEAAESPEITDVLPIAETPEFIEVTKTSEDTVVEEAPCEEPAVTESTARRGRLDRKAIRSLYDDAPESNEPAADVLTSPEPEAEKPLHNETSTPSAPTQDKAEPLEEPVMKNEQDAVTRPMNFAAHKKVVLGEVINQGGRTVGESIAPQAKKKIDAEKVSDIRKAIGVNDRYLIMRDLFEGDAAAFDEAVASLNGFADLNDAMLFIHDTYQWNHDSDGAKLLIDIIVRKLM